jgi:hypothetical protein
MDKTINEPRRFKRIALKEERPPILDTPASRESLKEFLSKSFKNYPEVVALFEESGYDASMLSDVLEYDDDEWKEIGIKNALLKTSMKAFGTKLRME